MDIHDSLEKHFGFRKFLTAQEEVVAALLQGDDSLVVMPTGGGKSLCYQLPALVMEGVTIVVSPLIALMKDQVDALVAKGIPATLINSTLSPSEQSERIREMADGRYKLVYVAPERFRSSVFIRALEQVSIALFAVDEAHCLSQWGHDFRPDYLRLGDALDRLGRPQVAAFTATATPLVRDDILKHLRLENASVFVSGFSRPNLRMGIVAVGGDVEKFSRLRQLVSTHHTGIIYCATRKKVEAVLVQLQEWGVSVIGYHGGMSEQERELAQDTFLSRKADVAVATNAFGMGIDRSDIRFVAHFEIPGSVEAYYQEAGRAGRDGEPAVCELLFNYSDTRVQEFFLEGGNPSPDLIIDVYDWIRHQAGTDGEMVLPVSDITAGVEAGRNGMAVSSALSVLQRLKAIERFDVPGKRARGTRICDLAMTGVQLPIDREALAHKEQQDRAKLKAIVTLAYSQGCRQRDILNYFGESRAEPCGNCDICLAHEDNELHALTDEEVLIVKKALSGVARMSRKVPGEGWVGRFGRGRIVQCLLGSKSRPILDAKLDRLTTYGLLKEEGSAYVNGLFGALFKAGLLETVTGDYPLVQLTERGELVMLGKEVSCLALPERSGRTHSGKVSPVAKAAQIPASALPQCDEALLAALKDCRLQLARQHGNKPAYTIFADETLRAFARLKPHSIEAGMRIRGVGEFKAKTYLPAILEVISGCENKG